MYENPLTYFILENYIKIKHRIKQPIILQNGNEIDIKSPLHGCCIIFSKQYLKKYKNPFFNETFCFMKKNLYSIEF